MSATVSGRGAQIVLAPSGAMVGNNIDKLCGGVFHEDYIRGHHPYRE